MGGRGTYADGRNVRYTYKTSGEINGVKVLTGLNGKHSLPEESHSSWAYIKLNPDGVFRMMRIYDKEHKLRYELAYHREGKIGLKTNRFCIITLTTIISTEPHIGCQKL